MLIDLLNRMTEAGLSREFTLEFYDAHNSSVWNYENKMKEVAEWTIPWLNRHGIPATMYQWFPKEENEVLKKDDSLDIPNVRSVETVDLVPAQKVRQLAETTNVLDLTKPGGAKSTMDVGTYLQKLQNEIDALKERLGGGRPRVTSSLLMGQDDVVRNALMAKAREWWEAHNTPADILGEKLQPGRKRTLLEQYINSAPVAAEIAKATGRDVIDVAFTTKAMMASLASAATMILTGGISR